MQTNAVINAEICNYGPALFEAIRTAVTEVATAAGSAVEHRANQETLNCKINKLMGQVIFQPNMSHDALWQVLWQRVVYAGTLSAKATAEIQSMAKLVPLFQSLDHYDEKRFIFDEAEWEQFVQPWKARYGKTNWLQRAKSTPEWRPEAHFKKTTLEVWKMLVKDEVAYPGLKFSAWPQKIKKYLNVAHTLHRHRQAGNQLALQHYTEGRTFNTTHLTGADWVEERQSLAKVRAKFVKDVGMLTAMHTMMDLGLKTIKPDRVMTYLFSQLGWLQTLPSTLSKDEVVKAYLNKNVVEEMTQRADVLAYRLDEVGHLQTHRLLDIWFVKYGQEPEPEWGLTVNLQEKNGGIGQLFSKVKNGATPEKTIDAPTAARLWPSTGFAPVKIRKSTTGGANPTEAHQQSQRSRRGSSDCRYR